MVEPLSSGGNMPGKTSRLAGLTSPAAGSAQPHPAYVTSSRVYARLAAAGGTSQACTQHQAAASLQPRCRQAVRGDGVAPRPGRRLHAGYERLGGTPARFLTSKPWALGARRTWPTTHQVEAALPGGNGGQCSSWHLHPISGLSWGEAIQIRLSAVICCLRSIVHSIACIERQQRQPSRQTRAMHAQAAVPTGTRPVVSPKRAQYLIAAGKSEQILARDRWALHRDINAECAGVWDRPSCRPGDQEIPGRSQSRSPGCATALHRPRLLAGSLPPRKTWRRPGQGAAELAVIAGSPNPGAVGVPSGIHVIPVQTWEVKLHG